jgi:hypothetical protein
MTAAGYINHIIPFMHHHLRAYAELAFIQDISVPHTGPDAQQELDICGLMPIDWPPGSPAPYLTETICHPMKEYIKNRHPCLLHH